MMDVLDSAGPNAAQLIDLWRWTLLVCGAVFAAVLAAFAFALLRAARGGALADPMLPEAPTRAASAWWARRLRSVHFCCSL